MDRLSAFVRLLSLVFVVVLAAACSSNNECVPDPEQGEYCEALPTGS